MHSCVIEMCAIFFFHGMKCYFGSTKRRIIILCRRHVYFYSIVIFVLCFVTYTEIISYYLNTNKWFRLHCLNPTQCVRILLVADPQITGQEKLPILSSAAQYDGDRYLKKTYQHAFDFVQPDITIFLGDLMDEGSIATNEEYDVYLKRFFNVFPKGTGKQIWLPGDNDIGGENSDRVTAAKIERYEKVFGQADLVQFGKIVFVKANQMTHEIPKIQDKRDFYNTSQIFIVLSHLPLMFMPSRFVDKVLSKVQPQIIFAAHLHKAMIISTDGLLRLDRQIIPQTRADSKPYQLNIGSNDMYEILVPTCSYRMGTRDIGFGFALIEKDELQYTILWSPYRFEQLWNYLLLLLLILMSFIFLKCCK